jgi:hypothetical protein
LISASRRYRFRRIKVDVRQQARVRTKPDADVLGPAVEIAGDIRFGDFELLPVLEYWLLLPEGHRDRRPAAADIVDCNVRYWGHFPPANGRCGNSGLYESKWQIITDEFGRRDLLDLWRRKLRRGRRRRVISRANRGKAVFCLPANDLENGINVSVLVALWPRF